MAYANPADCLDRCVKQQHLVGAGRRIRQQNSPTTTHLTARLVACRQYASLATTATANAAGVESAAWNVNEYCDVLQCCLGRASQVVDCVPLLRYTHERLIYGGR